MKKLLVLLVVLALSMFGVSAAFAYDVKVDEDTYAKLGAKLQVRVTSTMDDPGDNEMEVGIQQARWYVAGQVTNLVKFGINYDMATSPGNTTPQASSKVSDGYVTLDFAKEAKLMTGIYRVAFSRIGLQDSYAYILIDGPEVVNSVAPVENATNLSSYRGAGITLWGDLMDGKLRYNVGIWDDDDSGTGGPLGATDDKYMMTGRAVFNLGDPEKGYTCAGCYLGKANVMNVGVGYMTQDFKTGTGDGTATAMTADFFMDQDGLTLEAAYVMSDDDLDATGSEPSGFYAEAAMVFGSLQPAVRYESFDSDGLTGVDGDYDKITAGVNWLISGHDAKIQFAYSTKDFDDSTVVDVDTLTAQLQIQF